MNGREKIKLFFSYYKPHKKLFALDLGCATVEALIGVLLPVAINFALNSLLPQGNMRAFLLLMLGIVAACLVNWGIRFVVGYYGHTLGARIEADMREDLFCHLQKLSSRFYDTNRTGKLMSHITSDLFEITEVAHHGPEDLFICLITVIGTTIAMFWIQWKMAAVVLALLVVAVLFVLAQKKENMRCSNATKSSLSDIHAEIETSISGIQVTRAFANEEHEKQRFTRSNERLKRAKQGFFRAFSIFMSGMELITNLMKVSVILVGGVLFILGQASLADIIVFNLFIMVLLLPIQKLVSYSEVLLGGIAGFNRFVEIMQDRPDIQDRPGARVMQPPKGEIAFDGVQFAYNSGQPVLKDIDLCIRPGETLALVGPSGVGKTTLCQLIPRFYEAQAGRVLIDGQDVREVTMHSLRKNIGIVQQNVFLFSDTVLENIRYGNFDCSEQEVVQAAQQAEIHQDILQMEQGYQTYVGEKGAKLSGGQKQRISLARMFLKNPPIIILDEATSALDSITENKIQGAINRLAQGRTMLVIAHRLSTIKNADRIAVMSGGRILELGTHEELMKKNGEYAKMYQAQYGKQTIIA